MSRLSLALLLAAAPLNGSADQALMCVDSSRECMIAAATSYLDALVRSDGSLARLAPNVRRTGNGNRYGSDAASIRSNLDDMPPSTGRWNTRFVVDQQQMQVIAFFQIGMKDPPLTYHGAERFKIEDGLITEIEAIFHAERGPNAGTVIWPE